ncbi:MAG: tRNA epoxyqueuosine(34) reductase QueG [bacterium]
MKKHIISVLKSAGAVHIGFLNRSAAQFGQWLQSWLDNGYHGDMSWMKRNASIRSDPCSILDDGKSIISIAFPYFTSPPDQWKDRHLISNFAWGEDYHEVIKKRLKNAIQQITQEIPGFKGRAFTDSAPLPEKMIAAACGIGWIGKNSLLLSPEWGSYIFLAEIVCNLDLDSTPPLKDRCGRCDLCVNACPNGAILGGRMINATKCASFLTIEKRGEFNLEEKISIHDHLFGCDSCQLVCPWNSKLEALADTPFACDPKWLNLTVEELVNLSPEQFANLTKQSPLKRIKLAGLQRNAHAIISNTQASG